MPYGININGILVWDGLSDNALHLLIIKQKWIVRICLEKTPRKAHHIIILRLLMFNRFNYFNLRK